MIKIFSTILSMLIIPVIGFSKISHPPTYDEIKKCHQSNANCEDLEEAKEYTTQEVDQLHQADDYRFEITLAIKSLFTHENSLNILLQVLNSYNIRDI